MRGEQNGDAGTDIRRKALKPDLNMIKDSLNQVRMAIPARHETDRRLVVKHGTGLFNFLHVGADAQG